MKDSDRYWQPVKCEKCGKHMGFAPYFREEYQCFLCNDLPPDWDLDPDMVSRYHYTE